MICTYCKEKTENAIFYVGGFYIPKDHIKCEEEIMCKSNSEKMEWKKTQISTIASELKSPTLTSYELIKILQRLELISLEFSELEIEAQRINKLINIK